VLETYELFKVCKYQIPLAVYQRFALAIVNNYAGNRVLAADAGSRQNLFVKQVLCLVHKYSTLIVTVHQQLQYMEKDGIKSP
jgi:hypothetical protein